MKCDSPTPEQIVADPRWLAHRFDHQGDRIGFVSMPREVHRATAFLNDQHIPPDLERRSLPRRAAAAAAKGTGPLHFIFHSGLAGSTLLARALDRDGAAMTLKEPAIFTDLVAYGLGAPAAAERKRALGDTLDLLARPFAPGEPVIVKTASVANGLAEDILELRPDSRALCLHAPLPVFLASIARKGLMGRLWGRKLFIGLRNARMVDLGFTDQDYFGQTDLQIAAAAWLAQQQMFARLLARFGPDRVRTIDSERVIGHLPKSLAAIADHFRLALDAASIRDIVDGPLLTRHAKSGDAFDSARRDRELRSARAAHDDEIAKVALWSEKVADAAGFRMELGAKLLA